MNKGAFQDSYSEEGSWCYGCGRLNEHGLQIKSYWDGEESVCHFRPHAYHTAVAGIVYGGLIASLIDCHSTGTASAAAYRAEGREMGSEPLLRYVTGSLHVDYLRPTPIDEVLEIRGQVEEISDRKVIVLSTLIADGDVCAKGRVIAIKASANIMRALSTAITKKAKGDIIKKPRAEITKKAKGDIVKKSRAKTNKK
jgi:acyl-coenzyme A thioesterase PaaI-like protein